MAIYNRETLKDRASWVEVDDFEIIPMDRNFPTREFIPTHPKEHLVCLAGEVIVESELGRVTLKKKDWIDIPKSGVKVTSAQFNTLTGNSEILWMAGHWPETHFISMFRRFPDYPLEYHYHDNDEYWFMFRGSFTAEYDGEKVDLRAGDVLATRMGHEHGIENPAETLEGVGFTPRLEGQKRFGHLTREEHGVPTPQPES
jgi:mannose-6-phosphate isomerase-like protein (cupin superfamily)